MVAAAPPPALRGFVHLIAFLFAPAGLVLLLAQASSPGGFAAAAVFGGAVTLLFLASSCYHLLQAGPAVRLLLRRVDHAMIFVAIAGMYTPFCLLAADGTWRPLLLGMVWGLAALGILIDQALRLPPWAALLTYLAVGWAALSGAPEVASNVGIETVARLVLAGTVYSVGALAFASRWPNPVPGFFGHHEVFHGCVTLATAVVYATVLTDILPGA
jgi:hemolysin III